MGGIRAAVKLIMSTHDVTVQTQASLLLWDLCSDSLPALLKLWRCSVHAPVATGVNGAIALAETSGLQALATLLKGDQASETARALAAGLLGELAAQRHEVDDMRGFGNGQKGVGKAGLQGTPGKDVCETDDEGGQQCAQTVVRQEPARQKVLDLGCVEGMLGALFDVAAAFIKWQGAEEPSGSSQQLEVRTPQNVCRPPGTMLAFRWSEWAAWKQGSRCR